MLLQVAAAQRNSFLNEVVDVERSQFLGIGLEVGANICNHVARAVTVGRDIPECLLCSIEVWGRAVEKAQSRICGRYHRSQRLPYLMCDGCRDRISRHQARL